MTAALRFLFIQVLGRKEWQLFLKLRSRVVQRLPFVLTLPQCQALIAHKGFKRLRYFGWLHPSAKKRFEHVKLLLGKPLNYEHKSAQKEEAAGLLCRQCQSQQVRVTRELEPLKGELRALWESGQFGRPAMVHRKREEGSPRSNGSRATPAQP